MSFRIRPFLVISAPLAMLGALAVVCLLSGTRVNLTPSYPIGLWHIEPLPREVAVGDRIFICPPPNAVFVVARERGYLGQGLCPGWFSPLIKTVMAVSGQHVVIAGHVTIDGTHIDHSSVRQVDGQGRGLTPATSGTVPPDQLFLFSEFAGSYDSRYFGPIPAAGVLGLAQPLLAIEP